MTNRKQPCRGVKRIAQAYCDCGWKGEHWLSPEKLANAHGELRWHRQFECRNNPAAQISKELLDRFASQPLVK